MERAMEAGSCSGGREEAGSDSWDSNAVTVKVLRQTERKIVAALVAAAVVERNGGLRSSEEEEVEAGLMGGGNETS